MPEIIPVISGIFILDLISGYNSQTPFRGARSRLSNWNFLEPVIVPNAIGYVTSGALAPLKQFQFFSHEKRYGAR